MGVLVYIERVSRYLKRENFGGFGSRNIRICNDRGVFGRFEKRIQ